MSVFYVTDLDGTLLNDNAALSEFTRSELKALLADGLPFSVASARSVVAIRKLLAGLPITLPVVESNGAFVSDLATGRHEIINAHAPDVAEGVFEILTRFPCAPLLFTFDGREDRVYYDELTNDGMRWYVDDRLANQDSRLRRLANLSVALRDQVTCFTVIAESELVVDIETAVREVVGRDVDMNIMENRYSPGWYWLYIADRRATKAEAVKALMDCYGLRDASLVAFGDELNDLPLFQVADQAIAVANASPDVKRLATQIIDTNEADSVVKYIRAHWTGEVGRRLQPH